MNDIFNASNEFNSTLKYLARIYVAKKRGTFEEEKAYRNNKRLSIIIASDPLITIESCSPFFLRYADIIHKKDIDALLKLDFKEEKDAYKMSEDGSNHSFEAMDSKINFIKSLATTSSPKEVDEILNQLQILLSSCCKYAIAVKESRKN